MDDPKVIARERRAEEMCLNCGRARWRHHFFAGLGTICPSNKGFARFADELQRIKESEDERP